MQYKVVGVVLLFCIGYFIPDILSLDKKMEFAQPAQNPVLVDCVIRNNQCDAGDFKLEIIEGEFATLERTHFSLQQKNKPVQGDVLVTSDDNQFGTLLSQKLGKRPGDYQVLIPFCGNPIMNIILIDEQSNNGVIVRLKSDLP